MIRKLYNLTDLDELSIDAIAINHVIAQLDEPVRQDVKMLQLAGNKRTDSWFIEHDSCDSNWSVVLCYLKIFKPIWLINLSNNWLQLVIIISLVRAWSGDYFDTINVHQKFILLEEIFLVKISFFHK